jgi:pyruvate dehydrogenase E2 component (dihydrolipoamide acetyltransferase)
VAKGQTILELENEKAVAPIPSSAAGRVASIRVKVGDKLSVGQVICTVSESGAPAAPGETTDADPTAKTPQAAPAAAGHPPAAPVPPGPGPVTADFSNASPVAPPSVRKLARDLGLDLTRVQGTASGGRITLEDVRAYIGRLQSLAFAPEGGAGAPAVAPGASKPPAERVDFSKWGPVTTKPLAPIRETIGRRMVENWNAIPHVTQFDEADISNVTALRKKHAGAYEARGVKLTLTPFVLKAIVAALKQHGMFNASLDEARKEIVFKNYYHLGLAVDTEQGLLVPVLRDVDTKSLLELSREVNAMADKARDRKVTLDEMKGGTFTLSNQGGIGGAHFTPIINKPEVAILGLGRGAMKPVIRDGRVEPRLMMPICLSYDHRIIDGGSAARFTVDLVRAIEEFKEEDVTI